MSVLVLTSTYPRWEGDTEPAFVHNLNKRLAENHKIITLAPSYPGAKAKEEMDGVTIIRYRYFFKCLETLCYQGGILPNIKKSKWKAILVPFLLIGMAIAMAKAHKQFKPRLVHNHWIIPQGIMWALLAKLFFKQTPSIITSHGGDLFSLNGHIFNKLKRFTLNQHNIICVVSEAMKLKASTLTPNPEQIKICPMGVDLTDVFTPPKTNTERTGIIFVGRLVSKKGVRYLLEAIALLNKQNHDASLTIVGDGPERQQLESLTETLQITKQVNFIGSKPQLAVRDLLRSHKIAVFPSIETISGDQEGLGLTIIEALGCGCIVIASELAAIKDIKKTSEKIYLTTPSSSDSIFQTLNQIFRSQKSDKCDISMLKSKFDWEKSVKRYVDLYEKILD